MKLFDPIHPGELIREDYMQPIGLSVSALAEKLGVSRVQLSRLLNGNASISMEMAARLAQAFSTSITFWLNLQQQYDVWQFEQNDILPQISKHGPSLFSTESSAS